MSGVYDGRPPRKRDDPGAFWQVDMRVGRVVAVEPFSRRDARLDGFLAASGRYVLAAAVSVAAPSASRAAASSSISSIRTSSSSSCGTVR